MTTKLTILLSNSLYLWRTRPDELYDTNDNVVTRARTSTHHAWVVESASQPSRPQPPLALAASLSILPCSFRMYCPYKADDAYVVRARCRSSLLSLRAIGPILPSFHARVAFEASHFAKPECPRNGCVGPYSSSSAPLPLSTALSGARVRTPLGLRGNLPPTPTRTWTRMEGTIRVLLGNTTSR